MKESITKVGVLGISRRGEEPSRLSLAEAAALADQSQFSHHFKRLVGVTPE
jgi:AraC-like DNA-binding protein